MYVLLSSYFDFNCHISYLHSTEPCSLVYFWPPETIQLAKLYLSTLHIPGNFPGHKMFAICWADNYRLANMLYSALWPGCLIFIYFYLFYFILKLTPSEAPLVTHGLLCHALPPYFIYLFIYFYFIVNSFRGTTGDPWSPVPCPASLFYLFIIYFYFIVNSFRGTTDGWPMVPCSLAALFYFILFYFIFHFIVDSFRGAADDLFDVERTAK